MKTKTFQYKGKTVTVERVCLQTAWNGLIVRYHYFIHLTSAKHMVDKYYLRLLKPV